MMEFASYEDMVRFEKEREKYYLDFIDLCNSHDPFRIAFYKRLFLDAFHPRYRATKRMYDGYSGGFWRDDNGYLCARHIFDIDRKYINGGEICIERDDKCIYAVYVLKDDVFYRFTPEQLEAAYKQSSVLNKTILS